MGQRWHDKNHITVTFVTIHFYENKKEIPIGISFCHGNNKKFILFYNLTFWLCLGGFLSYQESIDLSRL